MKQFMTSKKAIGAVTAVALLTATACGTHPSVSAPATPSTIRVAIPPSTWQPGHHFWYRVWPGEIYATTDIHGTHGVISGSVLGPTLVGELSLPGAPGRVATAAGKLVWKGTNAQLTSLAQSPWMNRHPGYNAFVDQLQAFNVSLTVPPHQQELVDYGAANVAGGVRGYFRFPGGSTWNDGWLGFALLHKAQKGPALHAMAMQHLPVPAALQAIANTGSLIGKFAKHPPSWTTSGQIYALADYALPNGNVALLPFSSDVAKSLAVNLRASHDGAVKPYPAARGWCQLAFVASDRLDGQPAEVCVRAPVGGGLARLSWQSFLG